MKPTLEKYEQHLKPIDHAKDELLPSATDEEISTVEKELNIEFPDDLRTLYKWHNGQIGIRALFVNFEFIV